VTALEKLTIETPEQVALEFQLASVGSRFLALAIDSLIEIAAAIVVVLVFVSLGWALSFALDNVGLWVAAAALLGLFALYYGYFAVFEVLWQGQTPGKRLIGLRVLAVSGRAARPDEILIRNVLRIIDQVPGIYAVGICAVLLTRRNQRIGDIAAGTVVVHDRPVEDGGAFEEPPASGPVRGLKLTDEEAALVEAFLRRRQELDVFVRERRAADIANRLRNRLRLNRGGESDEALLEALINEHRRTGRFR
jgi:uncharacterized RDD family membrane protein YckC